MVLTDSERKLLERDFRRKSNALQSAARRGELKFSPGTDSVRISDLQKAYRNRLEERFERRFGYKPDLSRLDADHPVDLIVGGAADQRLKMLNNSINRSIGNSLRLAGEKAGLSPGDAINSIIFK